MRAPLDRPVKREEAHGRLYIGSAKWFMFKSLQVAENVQAWTPEKAQEQSSYESGNSSDGLLDTTPMAVPDIGERIIDTTAMAVPHIGEGLLDTTGMAAQENGEGIFDTTAMPVPDIGEGVLDTAGMGAPGIGGYDATTLLEGIAALARGQGIVIEKLGFLEMLVGTVQFDMTWVRDDMKSVHQAMDRFADYVCDVQDDVAEVQRLKDQVSLDGSEQQVRKGKEHVVDCTRPPSASTSRGDGLTGNVEVADLNASHQEGGLVMQELVPYANNLDPPMNTLVVTATGRRDWGYESNASPDFASPPCAQTRASPEKETLEQESQQIEMSCQSTQLPAPVKARSMWEDYSTVVRDWNVTTVAGAGREEGWLSAKRGRWDMIDYGKQNADKGSAQMMGDHDTHNLISQPENPGTGDRPRNEGEGAASIGNTGASKNSGSGTWRGTARGSRPAGVQPRYHISVRDLLQRSQ